MQRIKENKERCVSQTKEHSKSLYVYPNVRETKWIKQHVKNNDHKDVHKIRRGTHEWSENFNEEKILKSTKEKSWNWLV